MGSRKEGGLLKAATEHKYALTCQKHTTDTHTVLHGLCNQSERGPCSAGRRTSTAQMPPPRCSTGRSAWAGWTLRLTTAPSCWRSRQGLTLVHFSPQPEPYLSLRDTPKYPLHTP